jgi:very-short-patch-repair endonuclease
LEKAHRPRILFLKCSIINQCRCPLSVGGVFKPSPVRGRVGRGRPHLFYRIFMPEIINRSNHILFRRNLRSNQTKAETLLWNQLRAKRFFNTKFKRQYGVGPYILDFFCHEKQLAIEIDGGQHAEQKDYDNNRTVYLNGLGIKVLRFWNNDVSENIDGVLEMIRTKIET